MSIRVMKDGRPYDRTDCREVREFHRVKPRVDEDRVRRFQCECGAHYHEVHRRDGSVILAHDPGTFWENDMPRFR